jgi:hypothetical protein
MESLTSSSEVDRARELMKQPNTVIFFHMETCGHCIRTMPAWHKLAKRSSQHKFAMIERAALPSDSDITGFPHFEFRSSDGKKKTVDGEQSDAKILANSLGIKLNSSGGLRRLRSRRLNTRRLRRRIRKTLRRT